MVAIFHTKVPLLDLNLCISNGTVSTKIYDKRDDFNFDTVNFPFWMAMSPGVPHMGYTDLNLLDSPELLQILVTLTAVIKPLLPNYFGRAIISLNFVRRFRNFIADTVPWQKKYSVSLKNILQQGMSEPEFYGDLVYRFRKIVGKFNFSEQFRKLINLYKRICYSLDLKRETACLVVNPIIVDGYASLFSCTTAVRASDSMMASL